MFYKSNPSFLNKTNHLLKKKTHFEKCCTPYFKDVAILKERNTEKVKGFVIARVCLHVWKCSQRLFSDVVSLRSWVSCPGVIFSFNAVCVQKGEVTLTLTENITYCLKVKCVILCHTLTCSEKFVVDFWSEEVDSFARNAFKCSFSHKRAPVAQSVLENKNTLSFASFRWCKHLVTALIDPPMCAAHTTICYVPLTCAAQVSVRY